MTYRSQTHTESGENRDHGASPVLLLVTALALALATVAPPADAGDIYKWVDKEGMVHYAGSKPADAPAESVRVNTDKTGNVAGQGALAAEHKKIEAAAKAAKEKEATAKPPIPTLPQKEVRRRCQQAREDLANIEAHGQMRVVDEQGNLSYATDKAKQQRIAAAKKDIREYCH
jgi:Domain of unknown function (DUF4124)